MKKEVRVSLGGDLYIDEHSTLKEFTEWYNDVVGVMKEAEKNFSDVRIKISSSVDYEGYPGDVQVEVWGKRDLNKEEIAAELYQETIEKLAKGLGITFHEANTLIQLKNRGVI